MLDNQSKKPVAKSNFTRYYPQLPSTRSQYTPPTSDNEEDNNAISETFLDPGSEFSGINDPAIKALEWKADKPSDFAIKATPNILPIH
ncbi:hypothetical protein F8M41_013379 [Gigaspora margarita]|uniref:Uncharacterized protein n=1 Tax=Gigaspora margarita TaxID=4874 RepID=A0A8H4EP08_GIGMA|nr:hypothetical protein F8M41_013379 [Gigaspora margarita]